MSLIPVVVLRRHHASDRIRINVRRPRHLRRRILRQSRRQTTAQRQIPTSHLVVRNILRLLILLLHLKQIKAILAIWPK
jgi:hypothetical protein